MVYDTLNLDNWIESYKQKNKFSNFQKCQKMAKKSEQNFLLGYALFMVKPRVKLWVKSRK